MTIMLAASGRERSDAPIDDGIELVGDAVGDEEGRGDGPAQPPNPRSVISPAARRELEAALGARVRFDEPMRRHTTLKLGGPADVLFAPATTEEVMAACRWSRAAGVPLTVIGGGSNLLVRDGGIRGLVISTRGLRELTLLSATELRVGAGVSTGKVLSVAMKHELGGVEFLGGVPGSMGGGLIMNAGTYLGELKDVTAWVESVRKGDGGKVRRAGRECGFAYRHSELPADEIVVAAELTLKPRPRAEMEAEVRALRARRHDREPKKVASAGSIFKNPPGDFAGRLIETAGLKGARVGGAVCSPVHANWLVNEGTATAAELLALIEMVRHRVASHHGITLELEVKVMGDD